MGFGVNPATVEAIKDDIALIKAKTDTLAGDLKVNDDALQSIQFEHWQGRSLNDFFNGRWTDAVTGDEERVDIDAVWNGTGLHCPAGKKFLAVYSRKVFSYPVMGVDTALPILAAGIHTFVGVEAGGQARTPGVAFGVSGTAAVFIFISRVGSSVLVVTSFLPADYDTVRHLYQTKLNKYNCELFIDGVLKAIILAGLPEAIPTWENNAPYAIRSSPDPLHGISLATLAEVYRDDATEITLPIRMAGSTYFVAADGDPLPPRQYALYTENTATKWNGQVIAAGSITSHPIPVWGYPVKTLAFQANGAGSLVIQLYAGGAWRTLKTVAIAANTLDIQALDMETPIIRGTFTPTGFPTTVNVAEVSLS